MRFTFSGKNYHVTNDLMEKIEKKVGRISRIFPDDVEANIALSHERQTYRVEVTIPMRHRTLRAEVSAADLFTAVDNAVDALEKQMVKYKNRVRDRSRRDNAFRDEALAYSLTDTADAVPAEIKDEIKIEKTKRFALKPMDPEEAVMEMELLGHGFYVFRNSQNEDINVVYRRKNGSYGLIEPEYF